MEELTTEQILDNLLSDLPSYKEHLIDLLDIAFKNKELKKSWQDWFNGKPMNK